MSGREKVKFARLRVAIALFAGMLGFLALWVAIDLPLQAGKAGEQATRVSALPDVHTARMGDKALVDGKIAGDTPLLRGGFVAFRRQQTQGAYRTGTQTVTVETRKQPLSLITNQGRVLVENADYRFEDEHVAWAGAEVSDPPASFKEGGIATLGFKRSNRVVAVGVVTGVGKKRSIKADFIVAGPRQTYLERLGAASESRLGTVVALAAIGLLLLLYGLVEGLRLFRS